MKKTVIASIIALGVLGGNIAHAADSEVQFIGAVTTQTCDLSPSVGGSHLNSVVQLGAATGDTPAPEVTFSLKAAEPSSAGCEALTEQNIAEVSWTSPALNVEGLGATSGTADDAVVLLKTANATKPVTINSTTRSAEFKAKDALGDGLKFTAQLKPGTKAGDFQSVAAFAIAYK